MHKVTIFLSFLCMFLTEHATVISFSNKIVISVQNASNVGQYIFFHFVQKNRRNGEEVGGNTTLAFRTTTATKAAY